MEDKPEMELLREEVAFWRKDAAARAWSAGCLVIAAIERGDEGEAIRIRVNQLSPTLAAIDSAKDQDWHMGCVGCGKPLLSGQHVVVYDEGERCHVDCDDPARRATDAEKAELPIEIYDDGFSAESMEKMIAFARGQANG